MRAFLEVKDVVVLLTREQLSVEAWVSGHPTFVGTKRLSAHKVLDVTIFRNNISLIRVVSSSFSMQFCLLLRTKVSQADS